jgi:nucleoside 2-deoxyribosyltransferase
MNVIKYETSIEEVDWKLPSIFLAGPTVRGHQSHLISWRPAACALLEVNGFKGNVIVPEFKERSESDKYRYDVPVWEFKGLQNSHVILFWIPRTRELIGLTTNFEIGYWLGRAPHKIVYGRPDDAYRITYVDIMWVEHRKSRKLAIEPIYNTLDKTVRAALDKLPI